MVLSQATWTTEFGRTVGGFGCVCYLYERGKNALAAMHVDNVDIDLATTS